MMPDEYPTLDELAAADARRRQRDNPNPHYPGSKAAAGVAQRIIGQMSPHKTYVELFAGSAAVFRLKRFAPRNVLCDKSPTVCHLLEDWATRHGAPRLDVIQGDALEVLATHPAMQDPNTLVYADPPYLLSTRTRLLYEWEFFSEVEHVQLINALKAVRARVMLSGYWSELYLVELKTWRHFSFPAMTRGGLVEEYVWCNFPEPQVLHDPRFAGQNFRERERIKRKRDRWQKRFAAMPAKERQVIALALGGVDRAALALALDPALSGETGE